MDLDRNGLVTVAVSNAIAVNVRFRGSTNSSNVSVDKVFSLIKKVFPAIIFGSDGITATEIVFVIV
jgi:hypothetical protein